MKTKIISIILTVAIAVTGFTVKSSAALPALVVEVIRAILISTAGSVAASAGYSMAKEFTGTVADEFNVYMTQTVPNLVSGIANSALGDSGLVANGDYDPSTGKSNYYFTASNDLTGDEYELVSLIAEKLNNSPATSDSVIGALDGAYFYDDGLVTPMTYEWMKTCLGNAVAEFSYNKYSQFAMENGIALENNGAIPVYDFNFVGPLPSIDMPEHYSTAKTYNIDGYTLTRPYLLTNTGKFTSATAAELAGCSDILEAADGTAYGTFKFDCTAYSQYVIYNDVLYYNNRYNSGTSTTTNVKGNSIGSGVLSYWKDINGRTLEAAGCTSIVGLYSGFCYTNIPNATSASPVATVSDDDFITTTGGTTIDIPRTDDEQAIADGIDLGIIDEDGKIVLDEDGNIVSIDGLNIDKLMQLIQQIADNGSISFDSVEEYLAEISRLLRLANVDSAAMNTVIANLKELEKAQSKDISEINANVAAIAEALTAAKEANLEFETPDVSIFDKFPFSLPWDFYNVISLLCTEEKAPVFTVPIETNLQFGSIDYEVDEEIVLDLTVFKLNGYDVVQIFTSTTSYLFFIICLIGATKKLLWK